LPFELRCINFVKKRVESGKVEVKKLATELNHYQMLNMSTLVKAAETKLSDSKEALSEDEKTLAFLTKSAEDVCANLRLVLDHHEDSLPDDLLKDIPRMRYLCKEIGVGHDWEGPVSAHQDEVIVQSGGPHLESHPTETVLKKKTPAKSTPFSWGKVVKKSCESGEDKKTSKMSIMDIQREELENRLTKENLARLEMGKRPVKSPLLDHLTALKKAEEAN